MLLVEQVVLREYQQLPERQEVLVIQGSQILVEPVEQPELPGQVPLVVPQVQLEHQELQVQLGHQVQVHLGHQVVQEQVDLLEQ